MRQMILDHIRIAEALRYLGYGQNEPDPATAALMARCERELLAKIRARFLYRVFPIETMDERQKTVSLTGCRLVLSGRDILSHLAGCEKTVLFCATLGAGVDTLIRRAQVEDMRCALIYDAMASAAIEQVCELAEEEIRDACAPYHMTWRFGAGYGDLPIEIQGDFLNVLEAQKKIGLCVSASHMLTPGKSVTAVIGLAKHEIARARRGCAVCHARDHCPFRKRGERCEFS